MAGIITLLIVVVGIIGVLIGRSSRQSEIDAANKYAKATIDKMTTDKNAYISSITSLRKDNDNYIAKIKDVDHKLLQVGEALKKERKERANLETLFNNVFSEWKQQSVTFPVLRRWLGEALEQKHALIEDYLETKRNPARVTAAELKRRAHKEIRRLRSENEQLLACASLYEKLAPWLLEYTDYSVADVLESIDLDYNIEHPTSDDDPIKYFVTEIDIKQLSRIEKYQLALDRYLNNQRKMSAWLVGIQYERYVGYTYEKSGYRVEYHGAINKREDLGVDLICHRQGETLAVQCKRLAPYKGMPVRENVVAQVYGAAKFLSISKSFIFDIKPVLVTSYELSTQAREFADNLGVQVKENITFKPYPCIKCNVARETGEKIYHLPFDLQYDQVVIGDQPGECYVRTVEEAEALGFRRAFRWSGSGN